mmetsp:Transcript_17588/g.36046  ORF Transcript_17588/g.36046 Transcript_17588/m.36046 type:complete len:178 (-) Transcript_17588:184-717(-)
MRVLFASALLVLLVAPEALCTSGLLGAFPGAPMQRSSAAPSSPQIRKRSMCAVAIPGDGVVEDVFVNGFGNFVNIYQNLLIARLLLSWFPAAQGVGALQPLYNVCDPYLNTFRGIIPPLGGIDFSPIIAFTLLQVAGSSIASLGAPLPPSEQVLAATPPRKMGPLETWARRRWAPKE